jgi:protein deglycase
MVKKTALLLAEGFEEIEALAVVDVLRRAGIVCDTIAISDKQVCGSHGISVVTDRLFDECAINSYDVLILPGGMPGSKNLRDDLRVIKAVRSFNNDGKLVAAICAAPIVLDRAGICENRSITCFPGVEADLKNIKYVEDIVVEDGNIITGRGPAAAIYFALLLVERLTSKEVMTKVKQGMQLQFIEDMKRA